MTALLLFFAGLALLLGGADQVTARAVRLAHALGIRPLVVGITLVAFGTSAPELAVGISASLKGRSALAFGNILGSNIANLLLILGLAALVRPLPIERQLMRLDVPVLILASVLTLALAADGRLAPADGLVLLAVGAAYSALLVRSSRAASAPRPPPAMEESGRRRAADLALLALGLALLLVGAEWMVEGAVRMALGFGLSETMIGLTIVAVGTSAPELATAVVAAARGQEDIVLGTVLGSCIYNLLIITAVTCLVVPGGLVVGAEVLARDLPVMAGAALVCVPLLCSGRRVTRSEGGLLALLYLLYLGWLLGMTSAAA